MNSRAKEQERFANYFRGIQSRFSRLYASFLTEAGITLPQYALLNLLYHQNNLSMHETGRQLMVTKPAVTYLVDRLEEKKYLKRMPHSHDRRVYLLNLSPKGTRIVRRAQDLSLGFLMETLDEFNLKERGSIGRFYELLSKKMDRALSIKTKVKP